MTLDAKGGGRHLSVVYLRDRTTSLALDDHIQPSFMASPGNRCENRAGDPSPMLIVEALPSLIGVDHYTAMVKLGKPFCVKGFEANRGACRASGGPCQA
jgi:hypothetical protein